MVPREADRSRVLEDLEALSVRNPLDVAGNVVVVLFRVVEVDPAEVDIRRRSAGENRGTELLAPVVPISASPLPAEGTCFTRERTDVRRSVAAQDGRGDVVERIRLPGDGRQVSSPGVALVRDVDAGEAFEWIRASVIEGPDFTEHREPAAVDVAEVERVPRRATQHRGPAHESAPGTRIPGTLQGRHGRDLGRGSAPGVSADGHEGRAGDENSGRYRGPDTQVCGRRCGESATGGRQIGVGHGFPQGSLSSDARRPSARLGDDLRVGPTVTTGGLDTAPEGARGKAYHEPDERDPTLTRQRGASDVPKSRSSLPLEHSASGRFGLRIPPELRAEAIDVLFDGQSWADVARESQDAAEARRDAHSPRFQGRARVVSSKNQIPSKLSVSEVGTR